jgi:hypothetical protein
VTRRMNRRKLHRERADPLKPEIRDPTAREVVAILRAGAVVPPALVADVIESFTLELEEARRELERHWLPEHVSRAKR